MSRRWSTGSVSSGSVNWRARRTLGFSRSVLVEMLGSFGRFRPDEFGMSMSAYDELARAVEQWRQRLSVSHPTEPPSPGLGL